MNFRLSAVILFMVGLLTVGAWTVPEWWALANPQSVVAECLPTLELSLCASYSALPNRDKNAYELLYEGDEEEDVEAMPTWALALIRARLGTEDVVSTETDATFTPPLGAQVVSFGIFNGLDLIRDAEGDFDIYQEPNGNRFLRLNENFKSLRAPDLHLVFTRNPDPMDEQGVGVDYIDLGLLRATVGAQSYIIPSSVNFDLYPVLVLYSPSFNGIMASATLR